jgi:hypothetical protein
MQHFQSMAHLTGTCLFCAERSGVAALFGHSPSRFHRPMASVDIYSAQFNLLIALVNAKWSILVCQLLPELPIIKLK